jgi:hypothetical protein
MAPSNEPSTSTVLYCTGAVGFPRAPIIERGATAYRHVFCLGISRDDDSPCPRTWLGGTGINWAPRLTSAPWPRLARDGWGFPDEGRPWYRTGQATPRLDSSLHRSRFCAGTCRCRALIGSCRMTVSPSFRWPPYAAVSWAPPAWWEAASPSAGNGIFACRRSQPIASRTSPTFLDHLSGTLGGVGERCMTLECCPARGGCLLGHGQISKILEDLGAICAASRRACADAPSEPSTSSAQQPRTPPPPTPNPKSHTLTPRLLGHWTGTCLSLESFPRGMCVRVRVRRQRFSPSRYDLPDIHGGTYVRHSPHLPICAFGHGPTCMAALAISLNAVV